MKTLVFEKPVRNVDGLLLEMRKLWPVISVASDTKKTYVYVDDSFPEDPKPIIEEWRDIPEIELTTMSPRDGDGIPVAAPDGVETHTIVARKVTPGGEVIPEAGRVIVRSHQPVKISEKRPRFQEGVTSFSVGPSSVRGDVVIRVSDASGVMREALIHVRFGTVPKQDSKVEAVSEEPEALPESNVSDSTTPGVFSKIRRLLGF